MANSNKLNVTITKVDGPLFSGEAEFLTVPGVEGEMTVLAKHEAFISPLKSGTITVKTTEETKEFVIESGTIEVSQNQATVIL